MSQNHAHALIIDDNEQNVSILAQMLQRQGVSSTKITRPALLTQTIADSPKIDLVFLDLEMPGVDGYQVLDQLKADERFENVPVIAYTVHVSEIDQAIHRGFHSFLGKPLDYKKFPDQLARILRGEPVWEAM